MVLHKRMVSREIHLNVLTGLHVRHKANVTTCVEQILFVHLVSLIRTVRLAIYVM